MMWVEVSDPEGTGVVGDNVCASSRAVCLGGCCLAGTKLLRKRLLRIVCLPDPSTRMAYWWKSSTSTTTPVLSHLLGRGPVWFWMCT